MYRIAPYYIEKVGIGERARSALAPTMMCVVEVIKSKRELGLPDEIVVMVDSSPCRMYTYIRIVYIYKYDCV